MNQCGWGGEDSTVDITRAISAFGNVRLRHIVL